MPYERLPYSFFAHPFSHDIHHVPTVGNIVKGFNIKTDLFLVGCLMGKGKDTGSVSFFKGRDERFRIVRNDQDGVYALGNKVFD